MKANNNFNIVQYIMCGIIIVLSVLQYSSIEYSRGITANLKSEIIEFRKTKGAGHYFASRSDGQIIPIPSLDKTNLTDDMLLSWARLAVQDTLTFHFQDYGGYSTLAKMKYSHKGWRSFDTWLRNNDIFKNIEHKSSTVYGFAKENIRIISQGTNSHHKAPIYQWLLHVPVKIIVFTKEKTVDVKNITLEVMIGRTHNRGVVYDSLYGIHILDWKEILAENEGSIRKQGTSDEGK